MHRHDFTAITMRIVANGIVDGPGRGTFPSVAATVHQAAETAEDITERDAGRERISELPQRHGPETAIKNDGQRRANKTAVKNQTAVLHHEDFRPRLAGETL